MARQPYVFDFDWEYDTPSAGVWVRDEDGHCHCVEAMVKQRRPGDGDDPVDWGEFDGYKLASDIRLGADDCIYVDHNVYWGEAARDMLTLMQGVEAEYDQIPAEEVE